MTLKRYATVSMGKRVTMVLAALLVTALGLIILAFCFPHRPPEPACQGKTLRQWLLLLDSDTAHKAESDAAASAIGSMGKQALPPLIQILQQRRPPALLAKAENWAVRFHIMHAPDLPLDELQYRAARACCILGGWNDLDIVAAIPALAWPHDQ